MKMCIFSIQSRKDSRKELWSDQINLSSMAAPPDYRPGDVVILSLPVSARFYEECEKYELDPRTGIKVDKATLDPQWQPRYHVLLELEVLQREYYLLKPSRDKIGLDQTVASIYTRPVSDVAEKVLIEICEDDATSEGETEEQIVG